MILLIRDNEIFEPRTRNYLRYFDENNVPCRVVGWNRNGKAEPDHRTVMYQRPAEYGKKIANIPNKIGWMLFAIKEIWKNRKQCDTIHACDIDAVLPGLFMGKILGKKVIFDIYDWIGKDTGRGVVYDFADWLHNICFHWSDAVVLCEEERKNQAKAHNDQILVIPNIPDGKTAFDEETLVKTAADMENFRCVISYVGVFDRDRGLENLLEVVSRNPEVKLNIAGFGVLENLVREYADRCDNIHFWGRVEYAVGQAIQKNSHLIAAQYYLTNSVHRYAAPNKYYESLYLGVPVITTEKTLVGSKVAKYDTGFVLDENPESLASLLESTDLKARTEEKKANCTHTWHQVYKNYYEIYMTDRYMKLVGGEKV